MIIKIFSITFFYLVDIYTLLNGRNESTVFLERISPEVIFLRPPEELVIEVRSRGRIIVVLWTVNGALNSVVERFANHREIYFRKETTSSDIGLYEVRILTDPFGQLAIPADLSFIVTSPGKSILLSLFIAILIVCCTIHVYSGC